MQKNIEYYSILTINDPTNYGNRLQNYALQQVLSTYGPTTTIKQYNWLPSRAAYLKQRLSTFLRTKMLKLKASLNKPLTPSEHKLYNFIKFNEKYINDGLISETSFDGVRKSKHTEIKKVVIGSDQVWNYTFNLSDEDLKMRMGADFPAEKLISYAASIGLDSIEISKQEIFKEYISRIQHISMREKEACELIESICNVPATLVLDPTFLMTPEQWNHLFTGFTAQKKKYILTYFLGEPTAAQEEIINQYSRDHNCDILRINDERDPETYAAGPCEFVELIANSEFVFTDSYHACCFSIIFDKDFKVFNRNTKGMKNMNSRMRTLFRYFNLTDTMSEEDRIVLRDTLSHKKRLFELQQESKEWLNAALR